jgi:hypothetical protein
MIIRERERESVYFTRPLNHDYQRERERESVCVYIKITYPYFICGVRLKIVNIIKLCQKYIKKNLKII